MKKELAFILFTVVIALAGCMGNRDKGNDYMEEDSIRISNVPDTAFYGHLGDGTGMSCLQLVTNEGDTLVLNKTDEKSGEDGRILGEIANYTDQFAITTRDDNQSISVALNINQLAQSWQSQTDSLHGFSLLPDGKASFNVLVDSYERELIVEALKRNSGNMSAAARSLGLSPRVIHYKIGRLGITPEWYVDGE